MQKLTAGFLLLVLLVTSALASSLPGTSSTEAAAPFAPQSASDNNLSAVRQSDRAIRTANGKLSRLPAAEHLRRASVYMTNRAFAEAREHWEALLTYYPEDPNVPEALFGIGRSY